LKRIKYASTLEQDKCGVCYQPFNDNDVLRRKTYLSCGQHMVCRTCFNKLKGGNRQFTCPACQKLVEEVLPVLFEAVDEVGQQMIILLHNAMRSLQVELNTADNVNKEKTNAGRGWNKKNTKVIVNEAVNKLRPKLKLKKITKATRKALEELCVFGLENGLWNKKYLDIVIELLAKEDEEEHVEAMQMDEEPPKLRFTFNGKTYDSKTQVLPTLVKELKQYARNTIADLHSVKSSGELMLIVAGRRMQNEERVNEYNVPTHVIMVVKREYQDSMPLDFDGMEVGEAQEEEVQEEVQEEAQEEAQEEEAQEEEAQEEEAQEEEAQGEDETNGRPEWKLSKEKIRDLSSPNFTKYAKKYCKHHTLLYDDVPAHIRSRYTLIPSKSTTESGFERVYRLNNNGCWKLSIVSKNSTNLYYFSDHRTAALVYAIMTKDRTSFEDAWNKISNEVEVGDAEAEEVQEVEEVQEEAQEVEEAQEEAQEVEEVQEEAQEVERPGLASSSKRKRFENRTLKDFAQFPDNDEESLLVDAKRVAAHENKEGDDKVQFVQAYAVDSEEEDDEAVEAQVVGFEVVEAQDGSKRSKKTHTKNPNENISWQDLPHKLKTFQRLLQQIEALKEKSKNTTGIANVNFHRGRQKYAARREFSGKQKLKLGTGNREFGFYTDKNVAAIVVAATYIDKRLLRLGAAVQWLDDMIKYKEKLDAWIQDVSAENAGDQEEKEEDDDGHEEVSLANELMGYMPDTEVDNETLADNLIGQAAGSSSDSQHPDTQLIISVAQSIFNDFRKENLDIDSLQTSVEQIIKDTGIRGRNTLRKILRQQVELNLSHQRRRR